MVMSFSLTRIAQEGGSLPGKGLGLAKTFLYFVGAPVALFLVITGVVLLATASRKGSKSSLTHIE
jgi:hypothetical protein